MISGKRKMYIYDEKQHVMTLRATESSFILYDRLKANWGKKAYKTVHGKTRHE